MNNPTEETRPRSGRFLPLGISYAMGVFNDNFFRQATLLMAVASGENWYQGTAMAVFSLPYLVLGAPAGWLADRFSKRRVIIGAKTLELIAMLIGAIGVILQSWMLMLAMVGLMGTQSAFFSPALGGSIPEIFPRREVTRINARLRVAVTGAILLGVAGAGIALEAGPLLPEVLQGQAGLVAATILVVALGGVLTALRSPQLKPRNPAAPFPWTGVLDTLRELRRIYADPSLTLAVGVVVLVFFLGAVKILAANEMGIHQLNLGEGLTGAINFATLTGVAAGGMLSSWVTRRLSWRRTVFPVTLGLCASLFLLGGLPFLPPLLRAPSVYLLLFGAGTAGGMMLIPSQAFIQTRPDPDRRGAVIAASNFAVFSGILLSGPLASGLLALLRQPGIAAIGIIRRNLMLPPQIQRPLHMMSLLNPSSVFPVLAVLTLTVICWLLWRLPPPEEDTSFTDKLLAGAVRFLLSLRYRIDVRGLERVEKKGCRGILFLPNHPALIDPIILLSILYPRFAPRAWAIEHQIDRFLIRHLARRIGVLTFPAFGDDPDAARERLQDLKRTSVEQLKRGRNFLIYPSGHAYRTGQEDLRGNSAVREILNECPDARVVLVRTRGLWGSSFSWAQGHAPHVGQLVKDAIKTLLSNGIFFTPRRRIVVEFAEPADLPRKAGTKAFNNYLERFYNHTAHPPIYVPYTVWEKGPPRRYFSPPSPQWKEPEISGIPESVRDSVTEYLQELTGVDNIQPADYLGRDLGVDSLDRAEALAWMDSRWGVTAGDADSVRTVSDLMLAATGEAPGTEPEEIEPPPAVWRAPNSTVNDDLESAGTLPEALVQAAVQNPDAPIFADQHSGVLTYRRLLTAIFALKTHMEKLPGNRVGIMLPASVGGAISYLSLLCSGKTPVMVNWTQGRRNVRHCLEIAGVQRIVTARAFTRELKQSGTGFPELSEQFVYLETLREDIGLLDKAGSAAKARFSPRRLLNSRFDPDDTAVVLFTSGSESFPKAVPLSHRNILTNIRDIVNVLTIRPDDRLLGMLPPFHSFGLTITLLLPACVGIRTVYSPDPTDGGTVAATIDSYSATLLVGTPTFLHHILRARGGMDLSSLRLAVTGAEQCPDTVYKALDSRCPQATVLEGYGITECSPVISVNDHNRPVRGTIGKVLPSLSYALVHPETLEPVDTGRRGELLVRGPSVFDGYLPDPKVDRKPFVRFRGEKWYRTGDLVRERPDGVLEFCGRRKRFAKIGGEMISLPAVESVLEAHYPSRDGDPQLAVEPRKKEGRTTVVLFTTNDELSVQEANAHLAEAGLSPLHYVKDVRHIEEIPLLGTGKIDHRALQQYSEKPTPDR